MSKHFKYLPNVTLIYHVGSELIENRFSYSYSFYTEEHEHISTTNENIGEYFRGWSTELNASNACDQTELNATTS